MKPITNYEQNRKKHFCLTGVLVTACVILLITFDTKNYHIIAFASMGMVTYPFFELAILDFSDKYRLIVGVIVALILSFVLILGGLLIDLGPVWAALGFVIVVANYIFFSMLPQHYKPASWFVPVYYFTGMSIPLPFNELLAFAKYNFLGMLIVILFYALYYRPIARQFTMSPNAWLPTKDNLQNMWQHLNIKMVRYSVVIMLAALITYVVSIAIQKFDSHLVDASHTYWASYFVFVILQVDYDISKSYIRVEYRFFGTLLGLAFASLAVYLLPSIEYIRIFFLILTLILLYISYRPKTYLHFQTPLNAYLILLYVGLLGSEHSVILYRLFETIIGLAVSLITIYLLTPLIKRLIPD